MDSPDWSLQRDLIRLLVKRVEVDHDEINVVFRVAPHRHRYRPAPREVGVGKIVGGVLAQLVAKLKDARWFQAFGRFAAAAVSLLGVTLLALARPVVDIHWALLLGSAVVFTAELRSVHPIILIAAAVLLGAAWPLINDAFAGFYI